MGSGFPCLAPAPLNRFTINNFLMLTSISALENRFTITSFLWLASISVLGNRFTITSFLWLACISAPEAGFLRFWRKQYWYCFQDMNSYAVDKIAISSMEADDHSLFQTR
ncbi:hypothetical protein V2J09_007578 [Rumex salicifolius]